MMLCNKEGCEDAQDFIALSVNDANNGNASVAYKEYMLKDLEMEKKWIQQQVKFKAVTERINVYIAFYKISFLIVFLLKLIALNIYRFFFIWEEERILVPRISLHSIKLSFIRSSTLLSLHMTFILLQMKMSSQLESQVPKSTAR